MPARGEFVHEIRADEAGSAGDEAIHSAVIGLLRDEFNPKSGVGSAVCFGVLAA